MKKLILVTLILFTVNYVKAQNKDLPDAIMTDLLKKYPEAKEIKAKQHKNSYKIKFDNHGIKTTSVYDLDGSWKKTETILKGKNIPEIVKKTIKKRYPEASYDSVKLIETKTGKYNYKVSVNTENSTYKVELDKNGEITKTEQVLKETSPKNSGANNE